MKQKSKFKQTEIGMIPEDWEVKNVGSITLRVTKGTTPTTLKREFTDEGINFIKVESITDSGEFIPSKFAHIDKGTNELLKRSIVEEQDVLFSIAGVIGRTTIVPKKILPANTNQAIAIIRPNKEYVNPKFLRYAVSNKEFIWRAKSNIVQTAQPNLSLELLSNSLIGLPEINEQSAIAKILSDLDSKIELNQQMNKTLEAIGLTLFNKWFNLADIPEDWQTKPLDEIAEFLNGLPLQKYPAGEDEEYLPVIKIRELRNGITDQTEKVNLNIPDEYIVEDGDVLFSWSGTLEVEIWTNGKGALNQHLFKVSSKDYPKWFYYYWTKHFLRKFRHIAKGKATTMGHIQRHNLTESEVIIPDKKTFEDMNKIMTPIVERLITINLESQNLSQIRDSLLPRLMSGKIRVPVEVRA